MLRQFPAAEEELREVALARLRQIKVVQDRLERRYLGAAGRLVWRRAATTVARVGDARSQGAGGARADAAPEARAEGAGGEGETAGHPQPSAAGHSGSGGGSAWGKPLLGFLVDAARDAEAKDQTVWKLDPDALQERAVANVVPGQGSSRCVGGSSGSGSDGGGGGGAPDACATHRPSAAEGAPPQGPGERGGGGGATGGREVPLLSPRKLEDMDMRSPLLVSDMMLKLNFLVEHVHNLEARMQDLGGEVAASRAQAHRPAGS